MRTAIYIEDGLVQVVLAPETDQEKAILTLIEKKRRFRCTADPFMSVGAAGFVEKILRPMASAMSQPSLTIA